jgi:hypothetical protein
VFFVIEELPENPTFKAVQLPRDLKILVAIVLPIFVLNRLMQSVFSKKLGENSKPRNEIFNRDNPHLHKVIAFFATIFVISILLSLQGR